MNGVVKRKLPPKVQQRIRPEANSHHLMGSCRIGPRVKLWCSCTWKWEGEVHWSKEREIFEAHFSGTE